VPETETDVLFGNGLHGYEKDIGLGHGHGLGLGKDIGHEKDIGLGNLTQLL
jgi:hypothetical protein